MRVFDDIRHRFERLRPARPLGRPGRLALGLLAALFVVFFAVTLDREAFQQNRKGDLGVFLRAAWAAREGQSLYRVTDDHGWHYLYPPLFASLMIPLAEPPAKLPPGLPAAAGADTPVWLSASIWYWFSLLCLGGALAAVASALEADAAARGAGPPPPPRSLGWWALRAWPLLTILFFAGDALGRGQSTPLVLLLLAGTGAAMLRGRPGLAGFCLGFAGVMKLFPLYLLIYPLWRRDRPFLLGAGLAILAGLLIPVAVMGPAASLAAYREFVGERLLGEAAGSGDASVAAELHGTNSRIQSFEYMLYDFAHPDRAARAETPPQAYFAAHLLLSAALTAGALLAMRRRSDRLGEFLFFAGLALLVVPILPVSRPHYYALGALALAGLLAHEWPRRRGLWPGWPVLLAALANILAGLLDAFDEPHALELGLATFAALALAGAALAAARRRALEGAPAAAGPPAGRLAEDAASQR